MSQFTHSAMLVALGGGLGAGLRHAVNLAFRHQYGPLIFPWHTLVINVIGSFALGVLFGLARDRESWMLFAGTGLCGGFTTYSTFSLETVALLDAARPAAAIGYVTGTVLTCVLMAWCGLRWATR